MAKLDEILAEKFGRYLQRQSSKFNDFCQTKGAVVVIKAIAKLVAVFVTIYVIWHEFPELAADALFLWLLMTWGIYGVIVFWLDYHQAKKESTDEKLDKLIVKMDELILEVRRQNNGSRNNL